MFYDFILKTCCSIALFYDFILISQVLLFNDFILKSFSFLNLF